MGLYWAQAWLRERINLIYPLAASCSDVPSDDDAQRSTVNFGQRFAIHFPGEDDLLVLTDLAPWNRDSVVEHIILPGNPGQDRINVRVCTHLKYVSAPINSRCWQLGSTPPHALFSTFFRGTPRYTAVPLHRDQFIVREDLRMGSKTETHIAPSPRWVQLYETN